MQSTWPDKQSDVRLFGKYLPICKAPSLSANVDFSARMPTADERQHALQPAQLPHHTLPGSVRGIRLQKASGPTLGRILLRPIARCVKLAQLGGG